MQTAVINHLIGLTGRTSYWWLPAAGVRVNSSCLAIGCYCSEFRGLISVNQFQGPILFIKCLAKCLASLGSSIPLSGILTKTGKGDLTHPLPLTRWSPADIIFHVNKPERTRPPTNDKHVEISKRTLAYWNTGLKSPNSEEYHSTALVCAVNTRNHSSKEA